MIQLDPKQEQIWAMRAGRRASYFLMAIALVCVIVLSVAVAFMPVSSDPEGGLSAGLVLGGIIIEIVMLTVIGHVLVLRGLFKKRKKYQLAPNLPLADFRSDIWRWIAYAFVIELGCSIVMGMISPGSHSGNGAALVIAFMIATQLIAMRMVKKGKAHIELTT